jgi:hypothetical protein
MRRLLVSALAVLALPAGLLGQEFRATVNGTITDASKATLPSARVALQNVETSESSAVTTGADGRYAIPFLKPGAYLLRVEAGGFRKYTRRLVLEVSQTATVDVELSLGNVSEEVSVVAEAPLLDVSKADRGTLIDNRHVSELPLNARNPFMLSMLVAGVNYNGPAIYQRPFDNGAIADWSINGSQSRQNEFLLDGAPNNSLVNGNNIAYVPPVDSVQEFKIITNSYDAQYGRTGGGVVNVSLKSGTNALHGTVYEYARRTPLDANLLLSNARSRPRTDHYLDQYGFELDGPLRVPRLYDGKGKTFFLVQFEGYREGTPRPLVGSVPTEAMRRGDFSNYRDARGNLIVIYDPATGRNVNGTWVRDPFPGNIIPANRISPIAQKILGFYPLPNTSTPGSPDWQNNFQLPDHVGEDRFYNLVGKVDHAFAGGDRLFARVAYNQREELRNLNAIPKGPAEQALRPQGRINNNGVVDWVHLFSPTAMFNLRTGITRYTNTLRAKEGRGFDQTVFGFAQGFLDQIQLKDMFPNFQLTDYETLGLGSDQRLVSDILSVQPNMSLFKGAHSLRFGGDVRVSRYDRINTGQAAFQLTTNRTFTQAQFDRGDPGSGSSVASLLLGAPTGGGIDRNARPVDWWTYVAPWVQDDWKVTRKLTLNLGLRWDLNGPPHDANDNKNYVFDPNPVNPVDARIDRTRFRDLAQLRGGLLFAGIDGNPRSPWKLDKDNLQFRLGTAYQLNDKTVLRAGYGRFFLNPTGTGSNQGFSINTPYVSSLDGGRTPLANLVNPFPQGVTAPPGASRGLETFLGRGLSYSNADFHVPHVDQWSIGFERRLPWNVVLEMSYVGSRTKEQQTSYNAINEPSLAFREKCDPTKGGRASYCTERLPSPFYQAPGFEGTAFFTSPTLSRYDLNRPFPQFGGITVNELNEGTIAYDAAQVVLNKRTSHGVSLNGTYTYVPRFREEAGYVDAVARIKNRSPYEDGNNVGSGHKTHRITASWVWNLPFGQGKKFASDAGGALERLVGGWSLAGGWIYQSGAPWRLPGNLEFAPRKDPSVPVKLKAGQYITGVRPCVAQLNLTTGNYVLTSNSLAAGCTEPNFLVREQYQTRHMMLRDDRLRLPSFRQFDLNLAKTTRINDRVRLQIRIEAYNVFNTPMYNERGYVADYNNVDFGRINKNVTEQSNFPRFVQLAAKLMF